MILTFDIAHDTKDKAEENQIDKDVEKMSGVEEMTSEGVI